MSEDSSAPADVAASYLAAFGSRDPARIASHVSEDFINRHTSVLGGAGCDGKAAYLERLPGFIASMVDLHYEAERLVADGPDVAAFYTMTGRWQGGAEFSLRGVQHLRIEDGRITQRTDYWDSAGFLAQVDPAAAETLSQLGLA